MGQEGQEIPQEPAAEPSAVPRARGCLKGSKTGASQKPLTSTDTLIKSRCAVDSAMKFYHEKVHDRLTDEHINLLASTPFLHLFCFPKEFHLSSAVLHNILTFYDENQGVFTFKTKKFKFVPEEVSLFMGLPFDGPPVQFDRSILTDSTIRSTYFPPVFKRPFCKEFLEFCFNNFKVAVWSSRKWYNLDEAVNHIFGSKKKDLQFCWDQSECRRCESDELEKPMFCRELHKVWEKEPYTVSNTILIDDIPYKAMFNPIFLTIFPIPYKCNDLNDNALGSEGYIRRYLKKVAAVEDIPKFVKENPFYCWR